MFKNIKVYQVSIVWNNTIKIYYFILNSMEWFNSKNIYYQYCKWESELSNNLSLPV